MNKFMSVHKIMIFINEFMSFCKIIGFTEQIYENKSLSPNHILTFKISWCPGHASLQVHTSLPNCKQCLRFTITPRGPTTGQLEEFLGNPLKFCPA